jgi:hypothetical protein
MSGVNICSSVIPAEYCHWARGEGVCAAAGNGKSALLSKPAAARRGTAVDIDIAFSLLLCFRFGRLIGMGDAIFNDRSEKMIVTSIVPEQTATRTCASGMPTRLLLIRVRVLHRNKFVADQG